MMRDDATVKAIYKLIQKAEKQLSDALDFAAFDSDCTPDRLREVKGTIDEALFLYAARQVTFTSRGGEKFRVLVVRENGKDGRDD